MGRALRLQAEQAAAAEEAKEAMRAQAAFRNSAWQHCTMLYVFAESRLSFLCALLSWILTCRRLVSGTKFCGFRMFCFDEFWFSRSWADRLPCARRSKPSDSMSISVGQFLAPGAAAMCRAPGVGRAGEPRTRPGLQVLSSGEASDTS